MTALTLEQLIEQENKTLEFWEAKARNAEKLVDAHMSEAAENRLDAIYARNCIGRQKLKIQELEKELNERPTDNN